MASPMGFHRRSAAALPPVEDVKHRNPLTTENAPSTPSGRSAVNFATSPAFTPARTGFATPFTKVKSVMSTATVPEPGRTSVPAERSKNVFWAGFNVVPAANVSVDVSATETACASVPPALTTIG